MREDRRVYVSSGSLSPDEVAGRTFALAFRGFDTTEVRTYLGRMADELRRAADREQELRRSLADAEDRAAHPELDEPTLTRALGQEAARLLQTAHEAAADVRARAEESVAKLLKEAHEQSDEIRGKAESILGERTAEAEVAAAEIRGAAEGQVASVVEEARQEAESMLEGVRSECKEMVEQAQELRAKVLNDLARRRKVVHTQVEQLRAGRDSLVESFREVRLSLDHINDELQRAESDARQAAEVAVRRVAEEKEPTEEELERQVSDGETGPGRAGAARAGAARATAPTIGPATRAAEPAKAGDEDGLGARPVTPSAVRVSGSEDAAGAAGADGGASPPATEERRLSSLRILRRPRKAEPAPPPPGMTELRPRAEEEEGVRIIDPASSSSAPDEVEGREADEARGDEGKAAVAAGPRPSVQDIFARMRAAREDTGEDTGAGQEEAEASAGSGPSGEAVVAAGEDRMTAQVTSPAEVEAADRPASRAAAHAPAHAAARAAPAAVSVAASEKGGSQAGEDAEAGPGDGDEPLLRRRDELLEPIHQRLVRKLKRLVQDEQNDVLDRLRSYRGKPSVEVLLLSEEAQTARYADATRPLLEEALAAGIRFGAKEGEGETPEGADAEEVARDLATSIGMAIRRKLERAAEQGGDEATMSDSVGAAYREWKGKRADRVAGDHVASAFAVGVLAATPDGGELRWVVDDGEDRCPDCDDNALGGPTAKGEAYPTGQVHPPAHPGCRCILVPTP